MVRIFTFWLFYWSLCFAAESYPDPANMVIPLTSIYVTLQSHKSDFNIEVLDLI